MKISVIALIATYRRPRELARLLESLAGIGSGLALAVVVDNGGSAEVRAVVETARCPVRYVNPGGNLGCGGGLRLAGERALELAGTGGEAVTHFAILDDDAVVPPGTFDVLAEAMEATGAELSYPLVVDERGLVGWVPGVVGEGRAMERAGDLTPVEFRQRFGSEPRDFTWAQGICLLVARRAVEAQGWHRDDFWVRGEDLEFSLRLTAQGRGVFVPRAVVKHLPPPESAAASRATEYLRHCALVQNMAYIALRLRHGRRIAWTVPGALRRFFRLWPRSAAADAALALWRGGVRGEPAGRGTGATFRARAESLGGVE